MDEFGVLVQKYGVKPQGKSAPMAASKTATRNLDPPFGTTKPFSKSTHNSNSGNGPFLDDQNDPFEFSSSHKPQNYATVDVFDGVFQMPIKSSGVPNGGGGLGFDMESFFTTSMNLNPKSSSDVNDDVIWGVSGNENTTTVVINGGDLLSSDPIDDFWGKLGKLGSDQKGSRSKGMDENKGKTFDGDDLIPGFGSTAKKDRAQARSTENSSGLSSLEELEDFATGRVIKNVSGHTSTVPNVPKKTFKQTSLQPNFIDMEGVFSDSVHEKKTQRESEQMFQTEGPDLENIFRTPTRNNKSVLDDTFLDKRTEEVPDMFPGTTFAKEKNISTTNFLDDFSSFIGGAQLYPEFEEREGESEKGRRARFEHYLNTRARMEQALANMNQREFQAQQEQEERHRIAEAMDAEMKRWAAGKEGNLRALLSSLQQVLGPEFGWQPVTLTDLITSAQVRVAYKKAALFVHPDKVQQKGASPQQKYVAEKVFDLLKEAWNKFNSEELR